MNTSLARASRPFLPSDLKSGRATAADAFARAVFANALNAVNPLQVSGGPEGLAKKLWPDDAPTLAIVQRAAASPAMTTVSGWASQLAETSVAAFVESLAPRSAAAALIARGLKVPLNGANSVSIPRGGVPTSIDAAWVAEGAPSPVVQYTLAGGTLGPTRKMVLNTVLSREMVTIGGEAVVRDLLRSSVAATIDATMFGSAAATSAKPAGLRAGVTPITASAATDRFEALAEDIPALIAALAAAAGGADPVIIAAPAQAAALGLIAAGYPVLSTTALSAGTVMAVDAAAFCSAFGSDPTFRSSIETTLHFESESPAQISTVGTPNTVAAPVRNAFSQDLVVTKVTLDAAWAMKAPNLVQVVESVGW